MDHSVELSYADQFSIDCRTGGYQIITIGEKDQYLVVPEGKEVPSGIPQEITVLQQPLDSIYLVATSAMDMFRELDGIDAVTLSGTDVSGWYIEEAREYFDGLLERLTPVLEQENTGKTVAFFFITANGGVNVRCSGDYIAKAIELAGGVYAFPDLTSEGSVQTTMNIQMEEFYQGAKDADILIYNSAIDEELETLDQLLEKSPVLKDFKAVQEGNVWCTGKNLFQESLGLGELIVDLHSVMTEQAPELTYLHPLT